MRNKSVACTAALLLLLVSACRQETSITGSSIEPSLAAPLELGLVSGTHNLVNPGPLCTGARTPGFYCQNQDGDNPNLTMKEFEELEAEASSILSSLDVLAETTVGEGVCSTGNKLPVDELVRHLAALSLNLAANLIDESTPLTGGSFPTVGDALIEAITVANDPAASKDDRNRIKDVLDDINNNVNTVLSEDCVGDDDGGGGGEE